MLINSVGYTNVKSKLQLLWENDDPTTNFESNTIVKLTYDESYDFLYILLMASTEVQDIAVSIIKNDRTVGEQLASSQSGVTIFGRYVTVTEEGIIFSVGHAITTQTDGTRLQLGGNFCAIPYRIYGRLV